ncbi:MAG: hypothetical protein RL538_241 [Candidatus Parcubacteria bacterium]
MNLVAEELTMNTDQIPRPRPVGERISPDDYVTVGFLGGSVAVILESCDEEALEVPPRTWMQVINMQGYIIGEVPEVGPPVPVEVRRADKIINFK